jgi:hypothetical protein
MATERQIINPNNAGSIKFAATQAALDAATEQGFQIQDFSAVPKANMSSAAGTYGAPPVDVPGKTSWGLSVKYFQDWGLSASSLSEYLFTNDGNEVWFRIDPADAGVKGLEGKCYIVAGPHGGPAGGNWEATVTLPCSVTPTLLTAT